MVGPLYRNKIMGSMEKEEEKKEEIQSKKICPNCKSVYNDKNVQFCAKCGARLKMLGNKSEAKTNAGGVPKWIWFCAFLGVIYWIYDFTGFDFLLNKDTSSSNKKIEKSVEEKPDSTQLSIIKSINISFEELKKFENYEEMKVKHILVGYVWPNPIRWSLYIHIIFENDKNHNVKPEKIILNTKVRFRMNSKIIGTEYLRGGVSFDEDILPGMLFEVEARKDLAATSMPKEETFADFLNNDGEVIMTIQIPNKDITGEIVKNSLLNR